jgi:hypothetical protein
MRRNRVTLIPRGDNRTGAAAAAKWLSALVRYCLQIEETTPTRRTSE